MTFDVFISHFFANSEIQELWNDIFSFLTKARITQFFVSLFLVGFVFYVIRRIFGGD